MVGAVTITVFGIFAIFVIVLMAGVVCFFCLKSNTQKDMALRANDEQRFQRERLIIEQRDRREEQAFQQDMLLKQVQLCKEAGVPLMLNQQTPQMQMPVYSANTQQTPAYSVKLLGR